MGEVELSCRAYVKMYLHCCLYPRCSINGLLLSSSPAGGAVCVTDCVPLLHSHLSLAPITQLALTQVGDRLLGVAFLPLVVTSALYETRLEQKQKFFFSLSTSKQLRNPF